MVSVVKMHNTGPTVIAERTSSNILAIFVAIVIILVVVHNLRGRVQ